MGLISRMFGRRRSRDRNVEKTPVGLGEQAAPEETLITYADAIDVPEFPDPVHDDLSQDAYVQIRRNDVVARPVRKLATQASGYRLVAVGEGDRVGEIQAILDQIPGLAETIKYLTWAVVEGKRYAWMKASRVRGWAIPDLRMSGRRKVKAGGIIVDDGKGRVVKVRTDESGAKEYNRDRFIIFRVGGGSEVEGDTDLAWMLYTLCFAAQGNDKNTLLYSERHSLPIVVYNKRVERIRATALRSNITDGVSKINALSARAAAIGKTAEEMLEYMEPSGNSANFLLTLLDKLETRAHSLVLENVLTSITSGAGPTQSSEVHKGEQQLAVEALVGSLSETLTDQLLPFITRHNQERLSKHEGPLTLELQPVPLAKKVGPIEAKSLYDSGLPTPTDWLYDAFGAPRDPDLPEFVKREDFDPTLLVGPGGLNESDSGGGLDRIAGGGLSDFE